MFDQISEGRWWDRAWSLVDNCTKVSPGCDHCWLQSMEHRFKKTDGVVRFREDRLQIPLKVNKPTIWAIWSDVFHESVSWNQRYKAFEMMMLGGQHVFMVLTKRAELMAKEMPNIWLHLMRNYPEAKLPLRNVWLGITAENQEQADKRIPLLLQIQAAVRWVSIEPMLGTIDLGLDKATCKCCPRWESRWIKLNGRVTADPFVCAVDARARTMIAEPGIYRAESNQHGALSVKTDGGYLGVRPNEFNVLPKIDWVVLGGESGPGARPMHPDWARSVRDQCQAAGVPFMFKQWGEWAPYDLGGVDSKKLANPGCLDTPISRIGKKRAGRMLDGQAWDELPKHGGVQ